MYGPLEDNPNWWQTLQIESLVAARALFQGQRRLCVQVYGGAGPTVVAIEADTAELRSCLFLPRSVVGKRQKAGRVCAAVGACLDELLHIAFRRRVYPRITAVGRGTDFGSRVRIAIRLDRLPAFERAAALALGRATE